MAHIRATLDTSSRFGTTFARRLDARAHVAYYLDMDDMDITTRAVGTLSGSKVHTLSIIDGRGTSRTDCGARAVGMHAVTLDAVRIAVERGTLCRNCIGRPAVFLAHLEAEARA